MISVWWLERCRTWEKNIKYGKYMCRYIVYED